MTYDGNPEDIAILGSGAGWSLERIGVRSSVQLWRNLIPALGILVSAFLFKFWYVGWLERHYGIGQNDFSFRAWAAALPVFIVMLFFIGLLIRSSREAKPRSAKETLSKIKSA